MEAFAICGIDHATTTDDDEEHAQVIVDVAVIAADAAVDAPWERCVGETNVGLGLRRVGIAVRKAARTEAPAYVVDARISATRPGSDRGWTACAQLNGANPSLSSGGLTGSLRAPLLLWRRVAAPSDRAHYTTTAMRWLWCCARLRKTPTSSKMAGFASRNWTHILCASGGQWTSSGLEGAPFAPLCLHSTWEW